MDAQDLIPLAAFKIGDRVTFPRRSSFGVLTVWMVTKVYSVTGLGILYDLRGQDVECTGAREARLKFAIAEPS